MGRVYCAEQVNLGRTVAVKVVHPHLAHDEMAAARFINEARAASRLSHPHSVAIFDFGRTEEGHAYIVMEYLRGRDLGKVSQDEGPLAYKRIVDVLRQTLAALDEAHALGIVHRDLKPDNIVLEPLRSGSDFVKVVDFGLAKILEADAPASGGRALTRPGLVCGTPEYMSPEHARGDPLDGRSDLYSLGIVLFELLAGHVPFTSDVPTKTLLMHLTEPAPDPRAAAPKRPVPDPFAELILRALAKSREDRFQDARAMSEALERALVEIEGRPPLDSTPGTATRCRSCGTLNALGQKFCGECGAPIASLPPSTEAAKPSPAPVRAVHPQAPTLAREDAVGGGSASLPLLDRGDALAWLEARRHEAEAMVATAHVVGEAGMGKTRLLGDFLARSVSRGDIVVSVGPDSTWAKVGDAAVREAVRGLAAFPAAHVEPQAWQEAPAGAKRGLSLLFSIEAEPAPAPPIRRRAIADALRWAIDRGSRRAGAGMVILAVDDLDYVDGTSRNAFADVIAEPPVAPALLVMTYAPGTQPTGKPLAGESWTLTPLPQTAFADRVSANLAHPGTSLSPLHVEQLVAWARESNEPPPAKLADLIVRRAERLTADARHTLHGLAVWGDIRPTPSVTCFLPPLTSAQRWTFSTARGSCLSTSEASVSPTPWQGAFFSRASRQAEERSSSRVLPSYDRTPRSKCARNRRCTAAARSRRCRCSTRSARGVQRRATWPGVSTPSAMPSTSPVARFTAENSTIPSAPFCSLHANWPRPSRLQSIGPTPRGCCVRPSATLRPRAITGLTCWASWRRSPTPGSIRTKPGAT
jgi:serine/threonine-protein kinase